MKICFDRCSALACKENRPEMAVVLTTLDDVRYP